MSSEYPAACGGDPLLKSYTKAKNKSRNLKKIIQKFDLYLSQIHLPMYSARQKNEVFAGQTITLYEILKFRKPSASDIWHGLGLEKEYNEKFPSDELFWASNESLIDIYYNLLNMKASKN